MIVQLVFFEEHLMGSSGGVESTTEKNRKRRVDLKALCDIPFKHNNDMVESFELQCFCDLLCHVYIAVLLKE